jgi:hypothetical protein
VLRRRSTEAAAASEPYATPSKPVGLQQQALPEGEEAVGEGISLSPHGGAHGAAGEAPAAWQEAQQHGKKDDVEAPWGTTSGMGPGSRKQQALQPRTVRWAADGGGGSGGGMGGSPADETARTHKDGRGKKKRPRSGAWRLLGLPILGVAAWWLTLLLRQVQHGPTRPWPGAPH